MIRKIERHWFEVWGNEVAQNRVLKGLLALVLALLAIESISLVLLALRKPVLIALTPSITSWLPPSYPDRELFMKEADRVVKDFIRLHQNWTWQDIEKDFAAVQKRVSSSYQKEFRKANQGQIQLAKEKKLSQEFFISSVNVDLDKQSARVSGERILLVEGLRATNPMTFTVSFEEGARTKENPEGIYITGETLVSDR